MPRIRTIKPEFFRSPDTAAVSLPVRLFYQALWCWADDFGVGETNLNGLLGFAFCDEDGFTAQDLRGFCADVAQHYGVTFYTVRGRHYYSIPSWDKHQKSETRYDRRKYPAPDDPDALPDLRFHPRAESAPEDPRKSGADLRESGAGTGEQGNRGTEEQNSRPTKPDADGEPIDLDSRRPSKAVDLTADFEEWYREYPRKVSRGNAVKAYRTARKKTDHATLLAAIRQQSPVLRKRETQHIPHPASWLNAESWTNEEQPSLPTPRDSKGRLMIGDSW